LLRRAPNAVDATVRHTSDSFIGGLRTGQRAALSGCCVVYAVTIAT
jgi:hypothetical protein